MTDELGVNCHGERSGGFAAAIRIAAQSFTRDTTKMSCARE